MKQFSIIVEQSWYKSGELKYVTKKHKEFIYLTEDFEKWLAGHKTKEEVDAACGTKHKEKVPARTLNNLQDVWLEEAACLRMGS